MKGTANSWRRSSTSRVRLRWPLRRLPRGLANDAFTSSVWVGALTPGSTEITGPSAKGWELEAASSSTR